ncbi:NADP-dependent oxidoreductase [Paenibacillus sp. FJAT-27812]|uniref:NADP-dependent oxidoreductase n=1 Tax=Paenibacillus sp. FJAT-27812 TaxID=1684143 RepID=UPI0006A7BA1C|nr:NADP-dependent oxidoreductase [Paenibacillus sp. FJAT-27812]
MKGIGISRYGSVSQLKVIDMPTLPLQPDEVRIAIRASGVNPVDWKIREGLLQHSFAYELPLVLGWDGAGVVLEVGEKVHSLQAGDDVFFRPEIEKHGTYAEEINVPERFVSLMPKGLTYAEAASLPLVGLTVWQALVEVGNVTEGQNVLILAGSGGIGSIAIQLAKTLGARVTTTTSTRNVDFVRSLGADEVITYDQPQSHTFPHVFDFALDTLGGQHYLDAVGWMKPNGTIATIFGGPHESRPFSPVAIEKNIRIEYVFTRPDASNLHHIKRLVEMDRLKPTVTETYPMTVEGVREAHMSNQTGRTKGKIVLVRERDQEIH